MVSKYLNYFVMHQNALHQNFLKTRDKDNASNDIINGIGAIFIMYSKQVIRKQTTDACQFDPHFWSVLQSSPLLIISRSNIRSL